MNQLPKATWEEKCRKIGDAARLKSIADRNAGKRVLRETIAQAERQRDAGKIAADFGPSWTRRALSVSRETWAQQSESHWIRMFVLPDVTTSLSSSTRFRAPSAGAAEHSGSLEK